MRCDSESLKWIGQESPAVADKPARRESMPIIDRNPSAYNVVADNTCLTLFVWLLLPPKHEKCREIPREFDLRASNVFVSMESPYVTSY